MSNKFATDTCSALPRNAMTRQRSPFGHSDFLRHSLFGIRHFFFEQFPASTRVLGHIRRVQKPRNNRHSPRAGRNHFRKIFQFDSSNAKDRELYGAMRFGNIRKADWLIVRLRRRGEEWTEADVLRAFILRGDRLRQAVRRFPYDCGLARFAARFPHRKIILTDMHAFSSDGSRDLRMIVNDQRQTMLGHRVMQKPAELLQFGQRPPFATQLDEIHASFDHFLGHAERVIFVYVGQVQDAVEPGLRKRAQSYSCSRVGGALNSSCPEFITRSTNPVSYLPARKSAFRMIAAWNGTVVLIPVM